MTEVITINALPADRDRIDRAGACLRDGGLVAFPTETVYGLGVHALDRAAVGRLFAAKGRPANDPLIVHVLSIDDARALVAELPPAAPILAQRFWPGPLTLVMRRSPAVPDAVSAGLDTVGIRVPAHPVARALLEAAGVPIAAPSANLFSRPSPTTAAHVLEDLRDRIDMVIDAGSTEVGLESTVLDLSGASPTILRPGAVTLDQIRSVVPTAVLRNPGSPAAIEPQRSPGLLSKHYAPRAPLTLYRGAPEAVRARIEEDAARFASEGVNARVIDLDALGDVAVASRRLYAALRDADTAGADVILMGDLTAEGGLADAVRDRLQRASARIRRV